MFGRNRAFQNVRVGMRVRLGVQCSDTRQPAVSPQCTGPARSPLPQAGVGVRSGGGGRGRTSPTRAEAPRPGRLLP